MYFAPLSSPKPKHIKLKSKLDFLKIDNGKLIKEIKPLFIRIDKTKIEEEKETLKNKQKNNTNKPKY